jgi:N-acetyl-anhydromuramyl-L-alanine amidase AmpD
MGPPKSYTTGRKSGQPSVIVIHTTEGHEDVSSAEDGAAYDKRRSDGTSTHFFVDQNSVVQCVELKDEAHAARTHGNDIGIQIEICGLTAQSKVQWADKASAATLENVAKLCVQLRQKGKYPLTRLQGAALRSAWDGGKTRGFCGHIDITNAFPEDKGTHNDPGTNFPWTWLFNRIKELEGTDVATAEETWGFKVPNPYSKNKPQAVGELLAWIGSRQGISEAVAAEVAPQLADVNSRISSVASQASSNGAGLTDLKLQIAALDAKLDQIIAALAPKN